MNENREKHPAPDATKNDAAVTARGVGVLSIVGGAGLAAVVIGFIVITKDWHAGERRTTKMVLGVGIAAMLLGIVSVVTGMDVAKIFDSDRGIGQVRWFEWLLIVAVGGLALFATTQILDYFASLAAPGP